MIGSRAFAYRLLGSLLMVAASQAGCGDDDSGAAKSATQRTRGDNGEPVPDASVTPALADESAGKGCSTDDDCSPGMCLTTFTASGGGMMDAPGGYCSLTCMSDADCGAGGTCSGAFAGIAGLGAMPGRCLKGCAMDADCRDGYRCVTALGMSVSSGAQDPTGGLLGGSGCEPIPETQQLPDGVVGKACEKHSDCGEGRCQRAAGMLAYPDGYCTGACLQDSECGKNGVCAPSAGAGAGSCSLRCEQDDDCREGYRCRSISGQLQCSPGAAPLPDNVVGNACEDDAACGGAAMACASNLGQSAAVGGYCTQTCVDATDCGAGGVCVGALPPQLPAELAGLLGGMGASCYKACSDNTGCRAGYTCQVPMGLLGATSDETVCLVGEADIITGEDAGVSD